MRIKSKTWWLVAAAFFLLAVVGAAQQQDAKQDSKQDIPDAPSTAQPPTPFPAATAPATPEAPPPANNEPPRQPTASAPSPGPDNSPPPLPLKITTVPAGTHRPDGSVVDSVNDSATNDELYRITANVNQVMVPVMVKDDNGHMVNGLLARDFSVYEAGIKQKMNFFSSDPIPLSVAVILDLSMPDVAVQKVNQTFPALEGAFSDFDEVSIYTYSSNVSKASDFDAAGKKLTAVLHDLKSAQGRNNGPPVTSGPFGPQGPTVNGRQIDPGAPIVYTPPKEPHVLNDALLAAALDLGKRERTRRKVIFIITDGREYGSNASYRDTLKVLLSHGVQVYGIGVEGAAIPIYNKLSKIHLPKAGYTDILPRYANATGGEIVNEFSKDAIEKAYARAIGEVRNQYTLGYMTRATASGSYRQIVVNVARTGLTVMTKDGYYPLPPGQ